MEENENDNPIMGFIVPALGFICLAALAIQTWFFISWLMDGTDWWMKWMTLCFFDIFGGIWILIGLFHFPPTHATYQTQRAGVVVCFLLSASTTIAWCFIFITRTPLTQAVIASLVDIARWLVVFAVIYNAFTMIFYSVKTSEYQRGLKNPNRKRWATEGMPSKKRNKMPNASPQDVSLAQTATVKNDPMTITVEDIDRIIAKRLAESKQENP